MAENVRCSVLLDACVLYQLAIADSLISLAASGIFSAKWTKKIEQEWIYALEKKRPDLKGRLNYRRDCMREAIPDWEISENAWQAITSAINLPDPNDVHVLAAAIAGNVNYIVTKNTRDFPKREVRLHEITIIDPDRFIINQWNLKTDQVIMAFKKMRMRRKRPRETVEEFAHTLAKNGLPNTAKKILEAKNYL